MLRRGDIVKNGNGYGVVLAVRRNVAWVERSYGYSTVATETLTVVRHRSLAWRVLAAVVRALSPDPTEWPNHRA